MGWFDEQIRQRKDSDQEAYEEALARVAGSVLGSKKTTTWTDKLIVAQNAVEEVVKYYHGKPKPIPDNMHDMEERMDYLLRPYGIGRRTVKLKKDWCREAISPLICIRKEDELPVAMLPVGLLGYCYKDPVTGKTCYMTRAKEKLFGEEALSFYGSFPQRELKIQDLFVYIWSCFSLQDLVLVVSLTAMMTGLGLILPRISRALMGPIARSKSVRLLAAISVFLLCVTISSTILNAVRSLISGRLAKKVEMNVEAASMMRLLSLPPNFFRRFNSGEVSSRMDSLNNLCTQLLDTVMNTGLTSLFSLVYLTQIFQFAPGLALPAIVAIFSTVLISTLATLWQMRYSAMQMEMEAKNSGLSYALIEGVQKLRLSGAEKRAFSKWATQYAKEAALEYNPPLFLKCHSVFVTGIGLISTIIFYVQAVRTGMRMEDYFAFLVAYGAVSEGISSLAGITLVFAQIKPLMDMAEPLLATAPESAKDREVVVSLTGHIEVHNVSFRYSEQSPWILNNLSFSIERGEYVAIVGTTGCGKSTLMRLLLGFEEPQKGFVYYDGKNLKKLDLKSLRRKIGKKKKNGSLFAGDIYSNIAICAPTLSMEGAWEAAEIAGIADDIREMPMGMQTIISEGHGGISGGQKQRIMIARAIAPKPKVLMFDEATSALDNKTQKKISDALDSLSCTRIVIAHRLSTVRHCDRIMVMDKGKIVESGTFEELLAKNGIFADLVKRQRLDTP